MSTFNLTYMREGIGASGTAREERGNHDGWMYTSFANGRQVV